MYELWIEILGNYTWTATTYFPLSWGDIEIVLFDGAK
jgi:hypothetical protein